MSAKLLIAIFAHLKRGAAVSMRWSRASVIAFGFSLIPGLTGHYDVAAAALVVAFLLAGRAYRVLLGSCSAAAKDAQRELGS